MTAGIWVTAPIGSSLVAAIVTSTLNFVCFCIRASLAVLIYLDDTARAIVCLVGNMSKTERLVIVVAAEIRSSQCNVQLDFLGLISLYEDRKQL